MTTKEKLLELFEANKGTYFSGEELAENLAVSRAAVWKAVKSLRSEGYAIDAATNKGYCLSTATDILSPQGIRKYLNTENQKLNLTVLPTVTSTNAVVRELADSGRVNREHVSGNRASVTWMDGYQADCNQANSSQKRDNQGIECVVVANEQTKGRGRRGREFYSPEGTGVYMSLLLKPNHYSARQAMRFTTMAAVAMCEAIEEVAQKALEEATEKTIEGASEKTVEKASEYKAQIKWVNDIFLRGKKVCGILTEASFDLESGALDYAVLGVGINVYPPKDGFPGELAETAGYLFEDTRDDCKNRLAAAFLNHFQEYYQAEDVSDYTEKYRNRSLAMDRKITVISGNQTRNAFVYGIDEECRLMVRYDNGETEHLAYGEIKIQF